LHKRYLDCDFSELSNISKADLLEALRSSEGRILLAETIGSVQPMLFNITNAEFAASQGADLLLLNMFDVSQPCINAMPAGISAQETLHELKRLTGRVIGINLEPVDPGFTPGNQEFWSIKEGRLATADNARKAVALGVQFLVLTGNPGNGVSNSAINCSLREIKREVGDTLILIAGRGRRKHNHRIRYHRIRRAWRRCHLVTRPWDGSGYYAGIRAPAYQSRSPAWGHDADDNRHLSRRCRRGNHPADCLDVQNGRHRLTPSRRCRLCRDGLARKHHGL